MKNILVRISLLALVFVGLTSSVSAIQIVNSSSKTNSCAGANVSEVFYIDNASKMKFLYDEFWTSDDRLISDNKTKVTIWQSDSNLLEGCKDTNSWKRISSLSPGSNKHVIAMGANCTFKKPTNKNKRTLQFVYNVGYYDIFKNDGALIGDWDLEYYTSVADIRSGSYKTKHYDNTGFKNYKVHSNECLNVELRYCGDGIISNGETCDPQAPGFNEQTCSISTCTPITVIEPKVEVDKTDANPNDLDNNEIDSQLVNKGDEAVFRITVKNDANNKEALKNIVLTDDRLADCNRDSNQTKDLIKAIGNHDEILDLGESFNYVCRGKFNDNQSHWINTIKVVATGVTSGKNDDDSDPTEVLVQVAPNPICTGLTVSPDHGDVSFNSTLTCTGTDTRAFKIEIKDSLGNVVYTVNSNNGVYTFANAGNYTATCYVNDRTTTENVCIKPISATVSNKRFDLAITKEVTSTGPFKIGDVVEYKIVVENQGTVDATNVEVVDYVPLNMILMNGDTPDTIPTDRKIKKIINLLGAGDKKELFIRLKIGTGATGTITNFAEIFDSENTEGLEDCDSTEEHTENNNYTDIQGGDFTDANDNPNGCYPDDGDEDDIDPASITIAKFDLAITKEVTSTGTYNIGDEVSYKIVVENQGTVDATNVEVIDYIPEYMELISGDGWSTVVDGETKQTIASVPAGTKKELIIKLKILTGATGTITNFAEIFDSENTEGLEDCDSTEEHTENNNHADIQGGDFTDANDNPDGCYPDDGDEDDIDPASITIGEITGDCEATVTGAQSSAITATTSGLCKNTGETVEDFSFTTSGDTTNYTWACKDSSGVVHTGGNCSASYTTGGGGGGGGGGSGSSPACYSITQNSNEYTCEVNRTTYLDGTVGIDCDGDNSYEKVATKDSGDLTQVNGKYVATFTCNPITDPVTGVVTQVTPKCNVQRGTVAANQTAGWLLLNPACVTDRNSYCGDGVVQNPNSHGENEECDGGPSGNDTCTSTCKFKPKHSGSDPDCMDKNSAKYNTAACGVITNPTGGYVEITTVSNFAIGNGQKVFKYNSSEENYSFDSEQYGDKYLKIENVGTEPIYLEDKLCLIDFGSNKEIITGNDEYCESSAIGWIYPSENNEGNIKYFRLHSGTQKLENLVADTSKITNGETSETTKLVLTIKDSTGNTYEWSPILAGNMFITVAKPTIASQGGGTTYMADTREISKVNEIAQKVNDNANGVIIDTDQTNFTATVIGSGSELSTIDTVEDTTLVNNSIEEALEFDSGATDIVEDSNVATITNGTLSDFGSYKGIENVYFVKDKNIELSTTDFTESKTYIIENGNLTINGDITSTNNSNIAFIVKGGDIIINSGVTELKGTYISINKNSNGGNIKADIETNDKLVVNGSLYGNLSDLMAKRTHISMDDKGNISVGTLVKFGSNILNKPAPLVGQFIGEYMDSQKIAQ